MVIKFTCYTPQDVGEKLKKLQKDKCLNVSKFITAAIVEKIYKEEEKNHV